MWNREETRNSPADQTYTPRPETPGGAAGDPSRGDRQARTATVGSSVLIKGVLTASEDLTVDGELEGRIDLPEHTLTIGPNAKVAADIVAKVVTVFGTTSGKITAHGMLDIRRGASVEGEVSCTRISIQDGASFTGKVAMSKHATSAANSDASKLPVAV